MRPALRFAEFRLTDDSGCVWVDLEIGPFGHEGGELFSLMVCTADWLVRDVERNGARSGWAMLIVPRIDHDDVKREIESQLARLSADTWSDLALQLSRIAIWEFDRYVDHP
jgi:hypothetical protein